MYEPREDTWLLKEQIEDRDLKGKRVLEIGAGKGTVGLAAAKKGAKVVLSEKDKETVDYLRENIEENNIQVRESDLFDQIEGKFDLILFNPPYLPGSRENKTDPLMGGDDGTELLEEFLNYVGDHFSENGTAIFIISSKTDVDRLRSEFDIEIVDSKELWFETLYAAETD